MIRLLRIILLLNIAQAAFAADSCKDITNKVFFPVATERPIVFASPDLFLDTEIAPMLIMGPARFKYEGKEELAGSFLNTQVALLYKDAPKEVRAVFDDIIELSTHPRNLQKAYAELMMSSYQFPLFMRLVNELKGRTSEIRELLDSDIFGELRDREALEAYTALKYLWEEEIQDYNFKRFLGDKTLSFLRWHHNIAPINLETFDPSTLNGAEAIEYGILKFHLKDGTTIEWSLTSHDFDKIDTTRISLMDYNFPEDHIIPKGEVIAVQFFHNHPGRDKNIYLSTHDIWLTEEIYNKFNSLDDVKARGGVKVPVDIFAIKPLPDRPKEQFVIYAYRKE